MAPKPNVAFQRGASQPVPELPLEHPQVNREFIGALVRAFYGKVRRDARLGPIFDGVIGDHWEPHLERMTDFWSAVILKNGVYKGRPVPAHVKLKQVVPEDFQIWLGLFRETVTERCEPEVAQVFMERAERIAESLMLAMFYRLPAAGIGLGRETPRR